MARYTFTIRLDEIVGCDTKALLEEFLKEHDEVFPRYVISHEVSKEVKKPHYQGWIEATCARSSWQNWIKVFPHGRHDKSFAVMRKETYRSYVVKDGDVRYTKGITEDQLKVWRDASYTDKDLTQDSHKTRTGFTAIVDYVDEYIQVHPTETVSGWKLAELIMKWYNENKKCEPNDFQIRNMCKSIQYELKRRGDPRNFERYVQERAKQIIGHEWIY